MQSEWRIRDLINDLSEEVLSTLRLYHVELLRMNQKLNLISGFTEKNADVLHFYDAIMSCRFIASENKDLKEIYDLGSGSGFPGIIFAILFPNIKVRLVESDDRAAEFLRHIVARTEIQNAEVLGVKAENLSIPASAVVMCRGFSNLARTLLLGNKILPTGSTVYSLKGADWFAELSALPSQISSTWNNDMAYEYDLPFSLGPKVVIKSKKMS